MSKSTNSLERSRASEITSMIQYTYKSISSHSDAKKERDNKMRLLELYNEYAQLESLDMIYEMNDLDDFFSDRTASEILSMTKDFNIHAQYFAFVECHYTSLDVYQMKELIEYEFYSNFFEFIADEHFHTVSIDDVRDVAEYESYNLIALIRDYATDFDSLNDLLENCDVAHIDNMFYVVRL